MSDEQPPSQQPIGQLSPDGRWRWNGHSWVPAAQQYGGVPAYGVPQPGVPTPKKGMPLWGKLTIGALSAVVALVVLLTVVGLMVDSSDYSAWSCQDVADRAVKISDDNGGMLVLTDVTDLKILEDHRTDFTPPETGRGVVLSCKGTGSWDAIDDTPVQVELSVDSDGKEWVRYQMAD